MKNLIWKRRIGTLWPTHQVNRKIVLLYHSIGNTQWAINQNNFTDQISWLFDHVKILNFSDILNSKVNDGIQVAISFDDGYESVQNAANILSKKQISAILYINTAWIADNEMDKKKSDLHLGHYPDEAFLTWDEIKNLQNDNWEIGSHGANHYDFTRCDEILLKNELISSKNVIENKLSINCKHFSYPWGRYSENVKNMVKSTGYSYAVAGRHGTITQAMDLYAIPRINIAKEYSFNDFKAIVRGKWDYLGLIHKVKGI